MKVSIVICILNSPEVARRQILHFKKMDLPKDVEVIFVDDGSEPPLDFTHEYKNFNFILLATNDYRPWTQPIARNFGAKQATGEFLLVTDIDHILSMELIEAVRMFRGDFLRFRRESGVIDEHGDFTQNMEVLRAYGLLKKGLRLPVHTNSFAIKRDLFWRLGGMPERLGKHPNREETVLRSRLKKLVQRGEAINCTDEERPTIYMFPNGRFCGDKDYNPFGLFHDLERNTRFWKGSKARQ